MSRNCLFTVNLGGFITNFVRDYMLGACDRWGCDYAEIHELLPDTYASCSKYLGPERLSGYEKIMMLDGDCVISKEAPNPFAFLNQPNVLLAVADYLQAPNHCQAWLDGPYTLGMARARAAYPNFNVPSPESYLNGGFWLCFNTELARQMFALARHLLHPMGSPLRSGKGRILAYEEMGCTNLALHNTPGMSLCLLPETWNHIVPEGGKLDPAFYINHFAGTSQETLRQYAIDYECSCFASGKARNR